MRKKFKKGDKVRFTKEMKGDRHGPFVERNNKTYTISEIDEDINEYDYRLKELKKDNWLNEMGEGRLLECIKILDRVKDTNEENI